MKIAISSIGKELTSNVSEVFGRCPYFIIADIKDGKLKITETIKNISANQAGGAGISAAQLVAEKGVSAVITGEVGPRALDVFRQFNIAVYITKGSVKEALKRFVAKELREVK